MYPTSLLMFSHPRWGTSGAGLMALSQNWGSLAPTGAL